MGTLRLQRLVPLVHIRLETDRSRYHHHLGPSRSTQLCRHFHPSVQAQDIYSCRPETSSGSRRGTSRADHSVDLPCLLLVYGSACLEVSPQSGSLLTTRAWKVPALPYDDLHPLADYDRAIYLYKVSHHLMSMADI
jgi:hypothetical protein